LKTGVVGLGPRGLFFCTMINNDPQMELAAVCDLDANRFDPLKKHLGDKIEYFTFLREMLSLPELDAVVVTTNDPDHKAPTVEILQAGKHCLVEKPMAQTIEDCDEMLLAQRQWGKILMVDFELRYCVMFTRMRELIDRGDIGEIKLGWAIDNVAVGGNSFFHGKKKRKSFIKSLTLQKGCHTIDLLNGFMGGNPKQVFALGGLDVFGRLYSSDKRCRDCGEKDTCPYTIWEEKKTYPYLYDAEISLDDHCVYGQDVDVDDNTLIVLEYDNGKRAFYAECHFTPEYTREFTLIGDKGKIYGYYKNERFLIRVSYRHSDHIDEYHPILVGGGHGGGETGLLDDFVRCCREGETPLADGCAGRNATAVAVAAEESIASGQAVEIPKVSVSKS
ncbi:MAG: Gfo/Idh/MocA family oxidoreductase, partial [Candidatus Latescibacteria bacterium]|nr:Gfo/Idh/MocA family oxidoreductase [Candidatus Latescibacterota bacterium]